MVRSLASVLLACSLFAPSPAQCVSRSGSCAGGATMVCGTTPRIGTTVLFCAQTACQPSTNALFFGLCSNAIPLPPGLACFNCTTCQLWVNPILVVQPWPGIQCFGVAVPNNPSLVGGTLCLQNACLYQQTRCACLSNGLQVTLQR